MRIRHMAAAGAATAALTLGVALPASADNTQPSTGRSHAVAAHHVAADLTAAKREITKVKVYQDASYKNRRTTFTSNRSELDNDGWDNTISSAKSLGNCKVTFYSDAEHTGARLPWKGARSSPTSGTVPACTTARAPSSSTADSRSCQ